MTEPVLSVRNLEVEFVTRRRVLRAIDGISFDIAKGEVLGVVGESGAGKSVTGLAVIGLIDPPGRLCGGEIRLGGTRIDHLPPEQMRRLRGKRIGMIFQDPLTSLNPLYRIGDQLVETMRTHLDLTEAAARRRAIDLLAEVGIPAPEKRIDAYPHEFSGGQRQRIAIARALASEAEFIVCDEPTSALDVSVQAQILNLMRDLQDRLGLTYLFISHNLAVVRHMASRIGVMYLGRIVEIAEGRALFSHPRMPYTRMLLGAVPDLAMSGRQRIPVQGEIPNPIDPPSGCAFNPR
jgi:peptide/nickel transport system ATP-binding protein